MKKLALFILILLMAVPAFAMQNLTAASQAADGTVTIPKLSSTTSTATTATATNLTVTGRQVVYTAQSSATIAEINAGKTLVAGVTGKVIKVLGFKARSVGNFGGCTSVDIEDTNTSPVAIATVAVAAATNGALLGEATTNVTMGAGYLGSLTSGKGIAVTATGTCTTATSMWIQVLYTID